MAKKLAVLTSGGDSPGMNAAVRAMVKVAAARGLHVFGAVEGYDGLIDGRFRELTVERGGVVFPDPEIELLGGTGGTVLGSVRCARFREKAGRAKAGENLAGFEGLVVVGGNGSLTGAHVLASETGVRVMGIPASIDNDIGCTGTAIGVDTALNTIVEACDRISDTARAHRRAFVVEVMGRQCGYLAMASGIACGADAVLFREQGRSEAELVDAVAELIRKSFSERSKRRCLIIKAEGVEVPCTRLVRGVDEKLQSMIPGLEIRATVLGHVVRGGSPSYQDRMVSSRLGLAAVDALLAGETDQMVGWQSPVSGAATQDPMVSRFPLEQVIRETDALIDGSSPVTQRRVKMMEKVQGVLAL